MRIGVISDTHISGESEHIPGVILEAFKHVDMVIHAGDMVNLGAIDELISVCPKVVAVAGNMDSQAVKKKYPLKQVFEILGFKIGLLHGHGAPLNLPGVLGNAFKQDNCDVIIFGHSHKPMNEYVDGVLFFNPGSATDSMIEDRSYGIIEIDKQINARIIKI
jgi:uncharacterized protein